MRETLRFLVALVGTNLKASLALRGTFLLRAFFMMVNNLVFFVMWWVFFLEVEEIRGWRVADMAAITAVSAGAFGLAVVFGGGVRNLARIIAEGDLDSYLTQPRSILVKVIGGDSETSGVGDILSAVPLFLFSGYASPESALLLVVAMVFGAIVFLSIGVVLGSLAFFLGNTETFSRQAWEFTIFFSITPRTVFGGWMKLLLYTAIPAGLVSWMPVELVRDFKWETLLFVIVGTAAQAGFAVLFFHLGLRRYESGNRFGVRA